MTDFYSLFMLITQFLNKHGDFTELNFWKFKLKGLHGNLKSVFLPDP